MAEPFAEGVPFEKVQTMAAMGCDLPKNRSIRNYRKRMADPSPYRTIAVASTFSPRFDQVLSEAKRVRDRFGSELSLIYVGDQTKEVAERFSTALRRLSLPENSAIHYEQGDPAAGILRAIERHGIDLIIAGALEKEIVLHPFLGNVARHLLREGRNSVMLFTSPQRAPKPVR